MVEYKCYTKAMKELILNIGIGVAIVLLCMFLSYAFGLAKVFGKLGVPKWRAFIPVFGFMTLVRALHLPRRWFFMALIPYVGTIYSLATAQRLGKAFDKKMSFSFIWLTYGSSVGMPLIGFSKKQPDTSVLEEPVPNLKELQKTIKNLKKKKPKEKA